MTSQCNLITSLTTTALASSLRDKNDFLLEDKYLIKGCKSRRNIHPDFIVFCSHKMFNITKFVQFGFRNIEISTKNDL